MAIPDAVKSKVVKTLQYEQLYTVDNILFKTLKFRISLTFWDPFVSNFEQNVRNFLKFSVRIRYYERNVMDIFNSVVRVQEFLIKNSDKTPSLE